MNTQTIALNSYLPQNWNWSPASVLQLPAASKIGKVQPNMWQQGLIKE